MRKQLLKNKLTKMQDDLAELDVNFLLGDLQHSKYIEKRHAMKKEFKKLLGSGF
jgi:hypothetical protein